MPFVCIFSLFCRTCFLPQSGLNELVRYFLLWTTAWRVLQNSRMFDRATTWSRFIAASLKIGWWASLCRAALYIGSLLCVLCVCVCALCGRCRGVGKCCACRSAQCDTGTGTLAQIGTLWMRVSAHYRCHRNTTGATRRWLSAGKYSALTITLAPRHFWTLPTFNSGQILSQKKDAASWHLYHRHHQQHQQQVI